MIPEGWRWLFRTWVADFRRCPWCKHRNSRPDGGNVRCFHCGNCCYLECADKGLSKPESLNSEEPAK